MSPVWVQRAVGVAESQVVFVELNLTRFLQHYVDTVLQAKHLHFDCKWWRDLTHSRHWSILATYFYTNILEIDTCSLEQFKLNHSLYWLYQTITFSFLGFTGHFIVGRFLLHTIRNRKYSFKTSKINSKDCLFANPPKRNLLPFDQTVWDVWLLACKAVRQAGKQVYSSSKRTPELQNQHLVFFLFVCISKRDWVCT